MPLEYKSNKFNITIQIHEICITILIQKLWSIKGYKFTHDNTKADNTRTKQLMLYFMLTNYLHTSSFSLTHTNYKRDMQLKQYKLLNISCNVVLLKVRFLIAFIPEIANNLRTPISI